MSGSVPVASMSVCRPVAALVKRTSTALYGSYPLASDPMYKVAVVAGQALTLAQRAMS